jgi:hypothetical protein
MTLQTFQKRHLHYQVLYEYALLEYELNLQGKEVPQIPLKEPQDLLKQIKTLRQELRA